MKLWAMQGHPSWMSHSREFWQNMMHLRREWQTTLVYLPCVPHELYKMQKDMTSKDESPRSEGVKYATGEGREITTTPRMNELTGPKQIWHSVVDVSGDESKIWCCKEQHCIGTWNATSMNQGKLDMLKQEMVRININILWISKQKWMETGKFNSDNNCIYYCGQKPHRRNGVALIINKRVWNTVLGFSLHNDKIILVCFQGKPFKITVTQVYASTTDAKEAEVDQFYEDLEDLLGLKPKKYVPFVIRD